MQKKRILIVEDEAVIALLIETTLRGHNYEIHSIATNGPQAIEAALADPPDLILMDIKLQGEMLGTEAAAEITKIIDVPLIFLTAHSDPETLRKGSLVSPYGYVLKPFKAAALVAAIETAFEKHRQDLLVRQRDEKLNAIFSSSSLGIVVVNADLVINEINATALKMVDGKHDDALGKKLSEVFLCQKGFALDSLVALNGKAEEVCFQKHDGSEFWCNVEVNAMSGIGSPLQLYSLLLQDITFEKKMAWSLSLINRAVETVSVGIVITDSQGKIIFVNTAQAEMHGYRKEELLGKRSYVLAPSELRQKKQAKYSHRFSRESTNVTKDGRRFPVSLVSSLVYSSFGEIDAIVTTCEDITEFKENTAKIIKGEAEASYLAAQLESLLDGIQDSICLLTLDFNLVWSNNNTDELFDGTFMASDVEESDIVRVLGCPKNKLCLPEDEEPDNCTVCAAHITRKTWLPMEDVRPYGDKMIKRSTFPFWDSSGAMSGVIQVAGDVTEREALNRKAELSSRMANLGVMAASMGHEINNPNGIVMANAELVRKLLLNLRPYLDRCIGADEQIENVRYRDLADMLAESTEKIIGSSKRIKAYVERIRDFAVPTKGLSNEVVDVKEVVAKTLELIRPTISKFTDHLNVVMKGDRFDVVGNHQRLEQVLINLLLNAAQALPSTDKGVRLELEAGHDGKTVVLQVRDEGVGIPQEQLDKVRLPFYSTKESEGGSGLGLSIVDRIVAEHKGELQITSQPGFGTEVTITFPGAASQD